MLFLNESIADWHKYSNVNITSTLHYILMLSQCNVYVYKCMYTIQHIQNVLSFRLLRLLFLKAGKK